MADERPKWHQIILGQVNSRPSRGRRSIGVNFTPEFYELVRQGAERRGLSLAAYVRRAALAFAARDLGVDIYDVLADEPGVRGYAEQGMAGRQAERDEFGNWQIGGLS